MSLSTMVLGPAYLDRVLRIDRPLRADPAAAPIDRSVVGTSRFADGPRLELVDPGGNTLMIDLPGRWPGPFGRVALDDRIDANARAMRRLSGTSWADDLGGMGAGFAAALGGMLIHALGTEEDPISRRVEDWLRNAGISHQTVRVPGRSADWTLLVSNAEHGDKLGIGFRGCHAALTDEALDPWLDRPCDLRVVAGLPNRLAGRLLRAPGAGCRLFAPAMRNVTDASYPVASFAAAVDVLCCNRLEWESLPDREAVGWQVSILVVTDGPAGCWARFTGPQGETGSFQIPAFPRARPPRDTNRAGETLAATLIAHLLTRGWEPGTGVVEPSLLRAALERASAAAALVLDMESFGFPDASSIDRALEIGRVE